uniref:NADH-ubiquinone oxidoreductase chain 4L n=1 Tax=Chrysomeloidea sp. 1 KM-2017 TaxID=2219295 RepID=A0A346RJN8_9CUCU|nr:NADH dehydrogenase subunit 4L [Chrysomeloidea sp. 1 KM-2017]
MVIFDFLVIYMFFSGLIIFCLKFNHLLIMLLGVEFVVLSIFCGIFSFFSFGYDYFLILIYLIMSVSEGALSLGMLVNMIRNHGSDYVLSFSFLW